MLAAMIGPVDPPAASVLVAIVVMLGLTAMTHMVSRSRRAEALGNIELAKLQKEFDAKRGMYEAETLRIAKLKQSERTA